MAIREKFEPFAARIIKCDICGRDIYDGEKHYKMPDGAVVCDDGDCLEDWASEYEQR